MVMDKLLKHKWKSLMDLNRGIQLIMFLKQESDCNKKSFKSSIEKLYIVGGFT